MYIIGIYLQINAKLDLFLMLYLAQCAMMHATHTQHQILQVIAYCTYAAVRD